MRDLSLDEFIVQLSEAAVAHGSPFRATLLEAKIVEAGEAFSRLRPLRRLQELRPGTSAVLGVNLSDNPLTEIRLYVSLRIADDKSIRYQGLSLTDRPPFGVMSSEQERHLDPRFQRKIVAIENFILRDLLEPIERFLQGLRTDVGET